MDSNKQFIRDFEVAKDEYPFIKGKIDEKPSLYPFYVEGDFPIVDLYDHHWGTFAASIYFHRTYPKGFALLRDKSKVFPWDIDWHMEKETGLCCVCGPLENIEKSLTQISVLSFIENYVIPFYANQVYKQEFKEYKNGEYSHSFEEGAWESLEVEFATTDRNRIKELLLKMNVRRQRNDLCFCGSGIKYKKCHQHRIRYIQELIQNMNMTQ